MSFARKCSRLSVIALLASAAANAGEITLRLVCSEAPDQLVSTMVTKLDAEADAAKEKADEADAKAKKPNAKPVAKDQQAQPKAEFDHYTTYMRGIVIDGKHPFQKMYQNSFLGRSDVITLNLEDGDHVIDPGAHKFNIAGGKVSSSDPTLRANGATLDVVLFPVTMLAVDGSAVREMPAELRRLPVAMRVFNGSDELLPKEKFLSSGTTFKHLTIYMIANSTGAGYRLVPSERRFHLSDKGVTILDESNKPATDGGVLVEDKFSIVLPKVAVPVTVRGIGVHVSIQGPSGQFALEALKEKPEIQKSYYAFSSPDGAEIVAGSKAASPPIKFPGDLGAFPRRKIVIDATAKESAEPRVLQIATAGYSVDAGKTLRVRAQFNDAYDAATIAPPEVAAYLWQPPVLEEDGWLKASPTAQTPLTEWRSLRVQASSDPDVYEVVMPDVPSNIYWLRLVVDRRGECSPKSPLRADFIQGIINPAARTNVSVFCPTGRHAFLKGAELPFSVVVKGTSAIPAGKLRVVLKQGANSFPLVEQEVPALPPGMHPFHFKIQGSATAALAAGDYTLSATLGEIQSSRWTVRVSVPRNKSTFPLYADGRFSEQNVDQGVMVLNVPESIAAANEARGIYKRNAEILSWQYDSALIDWYMIHPIASYSGRDSSSEIAEVEKILRNNPSLPAHEVYYYQSHFESTSEALLSQGMGQVNGVVCNLSAISLMHSTPKDVHSEMRKFQLIAQIGKKFENFDGITLVYPNTDPMGNSEIVDPGRHARLEHLYKNFRNKYGFDAPPMSDAAKFMQLTMRGAPIPPEIAEASKRWEAWTYECNNLMGDFYRQAREAVLPLSPALKIGNEGPGWGGTGGATYPVTANANQSPLAVWTGFSDYAHELILEPFLRPKLLHMTGAEIWGTLFLYTGSLYNVKNHVMGHIAAGVDGFGYAGNYPLWDTGRFDTRFLPEEYKEIRDFLHTYGPMFRQAKPRGEIGIFYPFHQTMYEIMRIGNENWKDNVGITGAYSAMMQLALLGYDCQMLTEEMVDAGKLKDFKMVIVPALHYLTPAHKEALEKFAAEKPLLCGSLSTLIPKGAKKIDDDFNELGEVNARWNLAYPRDVAHAWLFSAVQPRIAKLREALAPLLTPFARPESTRLLVQSNTAGDARYTYVWSFLYPSWIGTTRVSGQPDDSAYHAEANEQTLMPLREKVSFPANVSTFDLLTQKPVDKSARKDGRVEVVCDLSFTPFKVFISLQKPIAGLRIEAPEAARVGTNIPLKISALDAEGKTINASIPLKIVLRDGAGKEAQQLSCAANPVFESSVGAPLGFAAGNWVIHVEELISGKQAETAINVSAGEALPFGAAVAAIPKVDVQRPDLIQSFIDARKKDGQPVLILLDDSQMTSRGDLAKEAVQQLSALGIKAVIKKTHAPNVFSKDERLHLWEGWTEMAPAQYIEHPIMLLGGESENVLIEELQSNQLLLRSLSASYPGPGRGVLTVVRSPFAFGRDVLCALGPDADGIRSAIAELAKAGPNAVAGAKAPEVKLVAKQQEVSGKTATPFAEMDGAPVQSIAVNSTTGRVAFGTLGYAKNVFVFDLSGKPIAEDKIGHVNTLGLELLPNGDVTVSSDGTLYLRNADSSMKWRLPFERGWNERGYVDPAGRYIVSCPNDALSVYDLNLKPLWKLDEWEKYETSSEILQARKAKFMAAIDGGKTIVYRLTGRAPGLTGTFGDDLVFADALTGAEQRRIPIDLAAMAVCAELKTPEVKEFEVLHNATCALAVLQTRDETVEVLLDEKLHPVQRRRFTLPPYMAAKAEASQRHLLPDRRLLTAVGDTLCLSNVDWTAVSTFRPDGELIVGMAVDETGKRIAVSTNSGRVYALDYELKKLWERDLTSSATLKFLPDGRLAAGTMRGQAHLLDTAGQILWSQSLNRFSPPEEIEKRWTELESLPSIDGIGNDAWWERLAANTELGKDIANLSGTVSAAKPLTATFPAAPFATYYVEWRHGKATGKCSLTLEAVETIRGADAKQKTQVSRLSLSATPQQREFVERSILRLGNQPESVTLTIQASGEGSADTTLVVRPIQFPSEDIVRVPALYKDMNDVAAFVNPAATVEMFYNPDFGGSGIFTANWAEPMCLINGRMFEKEPGLIGGKWFGGNNSAYTGSNTALLPCYVDITLAKKRFVSHIVIGETPMLARLNTVSIDAFVESRETRKGLSDFEARQAKRGYWQNVVKRRGNNNNYNVYKLPKIIYTNKLRVYLLEGYSSVDEIEVYETIPEQLRPKVKQEGDEKAHAPAAK